LAIYVGKKGIGNISITPEKLVSMASTLFVGAQEPTQQQTAFHRP